MLSSGPERKLQEPEDLSVFFCGRPLSVSLSFVFQNFSSSVVSRGFEPGVVMVRRGCG